MSFGGLILTNQGRNELAKAELGQSYHITHVVFGEGQYNGSMTDIKNLVTQVMRLPVAKVERVEGKIIVECDFSTSQIPKAFYWREIGIIANDVLCYYDNSRMDAEYFDPASTAIVKQKRMRFTLHISQTLPVTVTVDSSLYALSTDVLALRETVENHTENERNPHNVTKTQIGLENVPNVTTNDQTVTYFKAAELATLESGEKLSVAFGKLGKGLDDLISHIGNTVNPHRVTKTQIGLGNVPNVATDDQTPTFTEASISAKIVSGEKLTIMLGKIAKLWMDVTAHIGNKSNPHGVTKAQIGLGSVDNTSDAGKPVSAAQRSAIDAAYQNSNAYTDNKIANLINGAPDTLDTLSEIADAMQNNQSVVSALQSAIGSKANKAEFDSHEKDTTKHVTDAERTAWNNKVDKTGNASDTTVAFTAATTRANLASGEKITVAFGKIAKWFVDLKPVAWSGSYNDLSNRPTIPTLPAIQNNLTTSTPGSMLDASQGKVLNDAMVKKTQLKFDASTKTLTLTL